MSYVSSQSQHRFLHFSLILDGRNITQDKCGTELHTSPMDLSFSIWGVNVTQESETLSAYWGAYRDCHVVQVNGPVSYNRFRVIAGVTVLDRR